MLVRTRQRARRRGVPFELTIQDISIPETCPVLGIPLFTGSVLTDNSPTLDRIVPARGYVPGNVAVMSCRANRIKNDGTAEEHRRIAAWLDAQ